MSRQNYVGRHFINNVDAGNVCEQETGECIWQDSKSLLCEPHANGTAVTMCDHSILLIPVRLAKKMHWYATFDEVHAEISSDSNGLQKATMTWKEREEFQSIRGMPDHYEDDSGVWWGWRYDPDPLWVDSFARSFKDRPAAGKFFAQYIAAEAANHKAREETIKAIAIMIADARLSLEEREQLDLATQIYDEWPRGTCL